MSKRVMKALKGLDPVRVENRVGPGTPDIEYIGGWIENKWLRRWPKNANDTVVLDHYTPGQRLWHKRRWTAGGNVYVLLCVAATKEWLLFDGDVAADMLGRMPRRRLEVVAAGYWAKGLDNKGLRECITRRRVQIT